VQQAGLLSRATASNNCRKNIGLSKLSPDSNLYLKVAERRVILSSTYIELKLHLVINQHFSLGIHHMTTHCITIRFFNTVDTVYLMD
jgi:hypothetical protein